MGDHELPADSSKPVQISGPDGVTLEVDLPVEAGHVEVAETTTDAVTYSSQDSNDDVVVRSNSAGDLRVITTVTSPESPHEFSYEVQSDYSVEVADDGTLLVYRFGEVRPSDGLERVDIFTVAEPWALDANGSPVDTKYEVEGNTITQVVRPSASTTYPIVADPTWEWYDAAYGAGWNKAETQKLGTYSAASTLCAFVPGALKAVCSVGAASWIINTNRAVDRGGCVFSAVAPVPVGLNYDKSKNCR